MVAVVSPAAAATRNWNANNITANITTNLSLAGSWSGSAVPSNGDDAYLVWTAGSNNRTQTLTNGPANTFIADSLSITNSGGSGGLGSDAMVTFSSRAFFTNGVGRLTFAGLSGGNGDLSVQFSSNLTFKVLNMTGGAGAGVGTLTLSGTTQGGDLNFQGGTGKSHLKIAGPLGLTGTLTVTNLNATSFGTLTGNGLVARVFINNTANNRFTIAGTTLHITGAVASVAGGFTLANTATLNVSGAGGLILSNVAPSLAGTLIVSNSTLTGKVAWTNPGTVTLADGTLSGTSFTNTGTLTGNGTLNALLVNQARADWRGTASNLVQAAGSFTLAGPATLTGVATISGGVFDLKGQTWTGGAIVNTAVLTNAIAGAVYSGTVSNAGTLSVSAVTTFSGHIQNTGTMILDATTLGGGTTTNTGTIRGTGTYASTLVNLGRVVATNGTLSVAAAWQNAGTLQMDGGTLAGAMIHNAGTVTGRGTITAPLNNLSGSTLTASGGGTLTLTTAPLQSGTVNVLGTLHIVPAWANLAAGTVALNGGTLTGGTLTNLGTLTGTGTLTTAPVNLGTINAHGTLHVAPAWRNDGTLNVTGTLAGGTLTNHATLTSAGRFSNAVVQAGGRWALTGTSTLTSAATMTGGELDLQGQRLVAGPLDVTGGRLTNGVAGGTVAGNLNNSATVAFTADTFVTGVLSNTGALWFHGAVSNNLVNTGTVTLNNASTVTGALVLNAGTVNLHASPLTVAGLAGSGGTLTDSSASAGTTTVTVAQAGNTTFGGVIQDGATRQLALVKTGAGTLTLNGVNTFTGGTEVNGGTLKLGVANALPDTQAVLVNGGTFDLSGFSYSLAGVTLESGQIVTGTLTGGYYDVRSGLISAALAGSAGLSKTTLGTVTLAGSNTFTGGSTVHDGTLALAANERLANGATVTVAGGAFNLGGFQETVGTVQLTGGTITNGTLTGSAYVLNSGTVAGTLAGSASAVKTGAGTVWLSGANTYGGGTVVSGGTLRVNNTVGSGTGSGAVHVHSGATLAGNGTIGGAVTIHSGGHLAPGNSIGTNSVATLTLNSGSILDFEFKTDLSANDLTIVTTAGGLTIHGGGFNLYQDGTTTPFDNPGIFQLIQYSGSLGGAGVGALAVLNPTLNRAYAFGTSGGYVVLSITGIRGWDGEAANSFWTTAVNWGSDIAPVANDHLLFDGYTRLNNTNNYAAFTRFSGFTFTNTAGNFVLNGNAVHLTGNIYNYSANTQTINLPLMLDIWEPTINAAAGNIVFNGNIGQTNGPLGLAKTGAHTAIFNGANTYTGATEIQGGALRANDGTGLPAGSLLRLNGGVLEGSGLVSFTRSLGPVAGQVEWTGDGGFSAHGGTLTVNLGGAAGTVTWGSGSFVPAGNQLLFSHAGADSTVRFVNPIDFHGGMRTVTVANGSAFVDVDFIGALSGSGGWTKAGAGAARLSGASSYTGATVVNAGTLVVNRSLTSGGGVWVNAGGTLGGTGTVHSAITVAGHGVIAPGETAADIFRAASTLTLQQNFIYDWQLGITTNDVIAADSLGFNDGDPWTLRLGMEPNVMQYRATSSNDVYVLMTWQTGATPWGLTNATFVGNGRFVLNNAQVLVDEANQQVLLTGVWLIPEPNTLLLIYAGAITMWAVRRRQRRNR
jgi:autotransporter-associated beta strand protein